MRKIARLHLSITFVGGDYRKLVTGKYKRRRVLRSMLFEESVSSKYGGVQDLGMERVRSERLGASVHGEESAVRR